MYQINSGAEGLSLEEATNSNSHIFFFACEDMEGCYF